MAEQTKVKLLFVMDILNDRMHTALDGVLLPMWVTGKGKKFDAAFTILLSVRLILRIGEYSLVALQYRRIRYIGLHVSADTDTPAAITINSNQTRRLKHMVRVDRM